MRPKKRRITAAHERLATFLASDGEGAAERLAAKAGVHRSHVERVRDGLKPSFDFAFFLSDPDGVGIPFDMWLQPKGGDQTDGSVHEISSGVRTDEMFVQTTSPDVRTRGAKP